MKNSTIAINLRSHDGLLHSSRNLFTDANIPRLFNQEDPSAMQEGKMRSSSDTQILYSCYDKIKGLIRAGKKVPTLPVAATECKMGVSKFQRLFRHNFKTNYNEFCIEEKLNYAFRLLFYERKQVKYAASMAGYSGTTFFVKRFKQKFGIVPQKLLHQPDQNQGYDLDPDLQSIESIQSAILYRITHHKMPPSMEQAAHLCHMSNSKFRRQFKKYTGLPYGDYCINEKMKRAHELIHQQKLGLNAVTQLLGYTSPSFVRKKYQLFRTKLLHYELTSQAPCL